MGIRCFGSTFCCCHHFFFPINSARLESRITCIFSENQICVISAFEALFPLAILFNLHCFGLSLCRVYISVYSREYTREESKKNKDPSLLPCYSRVPPAVQALATFLSVHWPGFAVGCDAVNADLTQDFPPALPFPVRDT